MNVDALTLRIGDSPAKGKNLVQLVDGREIAKDALPDAVHLSKQSGQWQMGEWKSEGLVKRHGLQGPIGHPFNSKFLAVYGEGDRDLAIAELDAIRNPPSARHPRRLPHEGRVYFDEAGYRVVEPGAVRHREKQRFLKRIKSLPSDLLKDGAIFIYPNPECPSHYVAVWSGRQLSAPDPGLNSGWVMPLNLLPDYVEVKEGRVARGGQFDNDWKLRE
jgi:hypothetical protein